MKKLSLYIFLVLMWCNIVLSDSPYAEDAFRKCAASYFYIQKTSSDSEESNLAKNAYNKLSNYAVEKLKIKKEDWTDSVNLTLKTWNTKFAVSIDDVSILSACRGVLESTDW